jgi:S1-C subfamily serine protease
MVDVKSRASILRRRRRWLAAALLAIACTAGAAGPPDASTADLERQFADARRRLDEAARQMAELSTRLAGAEMQRIRVRAPHAVLGVNLGAPLPDGGIAIASVAAGGPAAAAGLRSGDAITTVNGRTPKSQQDLVEQMRALPAESTVDVGYRRNGSVQHVEVHTRGDEPLLESVHPEDFEVWPGLALEGLAQLGPHLRHGGPWNDLELATLSPKLGSYFGTEHGVLVVQAPAAASLKLQDGDVITAIDGREPKDAAHALRILGSYRPGETLHLQVMRERHAIEVEALVPPGSQSFGPLSPLPPRPPLAPTPPVPPAAPSSAAFT